MTAPAKVYLVGAGPGDPGLLTLRGRDCLARADLVLYDYLVNPEMLAHVRTKAERICLGRHGHGKLWSQEEINAQLVMAARAGRVVVRLKAGDPAVFARLAEEIGALAAAEVPFEIVPGITAALAASSYAGLPITDRDAASAVALVAGHESGEKTTPVIDYAALAQFPGTLVMYMGVTTAGDWSQALISGGKPVSTPCAIIRRCSWPDQRVVQATLGELAAVLDQKRDDRIRPPALVIIGEVAGKATAASAWFTDRRLFGQTVLVTRSTDQASDLRELLAEQGAYVLSQPAIEIGPPADWGPVDAAIAQLEAFDWLVFSSSNGVRYFLERLWETAGDVRRLGQVKLAVIGPGTADELARWRLRPDLMPSEYRAENLAAELMPQAAGRRCLLLRASRGREVLADELGRGGAQIEQVVVYQSRDVTTADPEIASALEQGRIDWITVTSSAIARSLIQLFGEHLRRAKLVSISPLTSSVLREHGFEPAAEARDYTMFGVVEAMGEGGESVASSQ